jgi:hypothetical protein
VITTSTEQRRCGYVARQIARLKRIRERHRQVGLYPSVAFEKQRLNSIGNLL